MRKQTAQATYQRGSIEQRPELIGAEQIHVRNHDHQWGYDLALEVVDADGEPALTERYYLQPGQVENELDALPPGEYEVRATLDNLEEARLECRIDADPEHTLVVEMGNGVLSLTQGLAG